MDSLPYLTHMFYACLCQPNGHHEGGWTGAPHRPNTLAQCRAYLLQFSPCLVTSDDKLGLHPAHSCLISLTTPSCFPPGDRPESFRLITRSSHRLSILFSGVVSYTRRLSRTKMAGDGEIGPAGRIQFAEGTNPAAPNPRTSPVPSGLMEKSVDLDGEEKARRIADQDKNQKRKQVCISTLHSYHDPLFGRST